MTKPVSFDELARMVKLTHEYWGISAKPKTKSHEGGKAE
jgi:hypothetical protein